MFLTVSALKTLKMSNTAPISPHAPGIAKRFSTRLELPAEIHACQARIETVRSDAGSPPVSFPLKRCVIELGLPLATSSWAPSSNRRGSGVSQVPCSLKTWRRELISSPGVMMKSFGVS